MITISKVKQATSQFIKVLRFGNIDVQTAHNVAPHGIDSKPVKGDNAVHSTTQNNDSTVVLGYILNSEKTSEGETRIFATDSSGSEVFDIYLKSDGTCEFGGNTDFFVRYNALNTGLQTFANAINAQLTAACALIPFTWVSVNLDISTSKIDNIKN